MSKKTNKTTSRYDCPRCGARDSNESGGFCQFRISVMGQIVPSKQDAALAAGCRVAYYTNLKSQEIRTNASPDNPDA